MEPQKQIKDIYDRRRSRIPKLRVLGDGVLIEILPVQDELTSEGGLVIPLDVSGSKEQREYDQYRGIVKQIGPLAFHGLGGADTWFKVGDVVQFLETGTRLVRDEYGESILRVCKAKDVYLVEEQNRDE